VTILTVLDDAGAPHGMTANSFTSVSLHPPLVLVCIDHRASIIAHFRQATHFGINILKEDQSALSDMFSRKGRDRFEGVGWCPGHTGAPLIPGALAGIECRRERVIAAGDHDILLGGVLHTSVRDGRPLIYFSSQYRKLTYDGGE